MITLITSGPDYKLTPSDLMELSRAHREMPISQLVTFGGSPGLEQWAKGRRIPVRIYTSLPELLSAVDAAIVFPGRYMDGLMRMIEQRHLKEVWDWRGTTQEAKDVILANKAAQSHYDAIVNGDIEPIGYSTEQRGRVPEAV